jgi:ribosomal protein L9
MRLLAPYLVQQMAKKAEEHLKKQFEQQQAQHNQAQKETPKPKKEVGDYIDYEEVE